MTALANAPEHWTRTTIGEIAEVRLGRQRSPKDHTGDSMQRYLRAANVTWYRLRLDDIAEMNFTQGEMETYSLREGDILVVEGGTPEYVGQCALVTEQVEGLAFQNTLIRVRPHDHVDPKWLMYRLNADGELGGYRYIARGAGNIQHISARRYASHRLAIPPLDEQRAIVETIERMLSHLDVGIASVRHAGARSRLLATALVARALDGAVETVPLSEIASVITGPAFKSSCFVSPGEGVRLLRGTNIWPDRIEWHGSDVVHYPRKPGDGLDDLELRRGDIVLSTKGSVVKEGFKLARVGEVDLPALLVQGAARVRTTDPDLTDWVYLAMQQPQFISGVLGQSGGTAGPAYASLKALRAAPIPMVSAADRALRVQAHRDSMSRIRAATNDAQRGARRGAAIRRSILKAAFEGRLTRDAENAQSLDDLQEAIA